MLKIAYLKLDSPYLVLDVLISPCTKQFFYQLNELSMSKELRDVDALEQCSEKIVAMEQQASIAQSHGQGNVKSPINVVSRLPWPDELDRLLGHSYQYVVHIRVECSRRDLLSWSSGSSRRLRSAGNRGTRTSNDIQSISVLDGSVIDHELSPRSFVITSAIK